jgi:cytochrome c oxidase subunit 3
LSDAIAAHAHGGAHAHPDLQHHFDTLDQQHEAATLGMWIFLITEVLFFGGLFLAYMLYRVWYPAAWSEIASSLTMALAVRGAQTGLRKATMGWLLLTMAFGLTFLVIKYFEYAEKFEHHHVPGPTFAFPGPNAGPAQIYFSLYFLMTGLHATHMVIGFGILSVILWMAYKGRFSPEWYTPVEISGLYWHFVDIVWIFLFPLLYLVDRAHHFG